jgi:hypothetical protein
MLTLDGRKRVWRGTEDGVEIRIDAATFQYYLHHYLLAHQLEASAENREKATAQLCQHSYWSLCTDPRIIRTRTRNDTESEARHAHQT